jgi:hypothetical protein
MGSYIEYVRRHSLRCTPASYPAEDNNGYGPGMYASCNLTIVNKYGAMDYADYMYELNADCTAEDDQFFYMPNSICSCPLSQIPEMKIAIPYQTTPLLPEY